MQIDLTTPSLLFPTVSLLMLAYTNRFLTLSGVVRKLHASYKAAPDPVYLHQIKSLRWRLLLIRNMQLAGVLSLLLCVLCMFVLFEGQRRAAEILFGASLFAMVVSLLLSLWEIWMSIDALNLHLRDIEAYRPEAAPDKD